MIIEELKIDLEPVDFFAHLASQKDAVFLDCSKRTPHRRYSIMAFSPTCTFTARGESAYITSGGRTRCVREKPMAVLKNLLEKKKLECDSDFPVGAAIGYIGYETGYTLEKIQTRPKPGLGIPDCYLNFYDSLLVYDNVDKKYFATSSSENINEKLRKAAKTCGKPTPAQGPPGASETVRSSTNRSKFTVNVERIKEYIREGDVYQVNLSQRFSSGAPPDPFRLYFKLRELNPVPHGAFLNLDGFQVLSLSPERFVRIKGSKVQTRPIKGTINRGTDPTDDARKKEKLYGSGKDRAELLMITDLERNDLGRVCSPHTVSVPDLLSVEEYSSVFHLVSTIEGELAPGKDHIDCLAAIFPGGSITGAPKIRAMDIIEELEPVQRNIYTGAIGYIGYNGQTDLNIAIRTAIVAGGSIYFHGGGGIIIDSDPKAEYNETLHKVKPFLDAISPGSYVRMLHRKEAAFS